MTSRSTENVSKAHMPHQQPQHSFSIASILERPCYSAEETFNAASDSSHSPSPRETVVDYFGPLSSTVSEEAPSTSSPHKITQIVSPCAWHDGVTAQDRTQQHQPLAATANTSKCSLVGRSPRVPFTRDQVEGLEAKFRSTNYLSSREVAILADQLKVTETRVKIWFQNRRARQRRESYLGDIVHNQQLQGQSVQPIILAHQPPQSNHPITFHQAPLTGLIANPCHYPLELEALGLAGGTSARETSQHPVHELATLYQRHFHENFL